ncbi:hypothetical protein LTR85_000118 [Meristemomyces frigidus]|nr:hypothetical protein LTR85_000118 [Meristemomyces frigidus]
MATRQTRAGDTRLGDTAYSGQVAIKPQTRSTRGVPVELPFTTVFLGEMVTGTHSTLTSSILNWIEHPKVQKELRIWKHGELDEKRHCAKMKDLFGTQWTNWVPIMEQLVDFAIDFDEDVDPQDLDADALQRLRLVRAMRSVLNADTIPGADAQDTSSAENTYRLRSAAGLLLTALKDMQDNPNGYFADKLAGRPMQPWAVGIDDDGDEVDGDQKGIAKRKRGGPRGGKTHTSASRARSLSDVEEDVEDQKPPQYGGPDAHGARERTAVSDENHQDSGQEEDSVSDEDGSPIKPGRKRAREAPQVYEPSPETDEIVAARPSTSRGPEDMPELPRFFDEELRSIPQADALADLQPITKKTVAGRKEEVDAGKDQEEALHEHQFKELPETVLQKDQEIQRLRSELKQRTAGLTERDAELSIMRTKLDEKDSELMNLHGLLSRDEDAYRKAVYQQLVALGEKMDNVKKDLLAEMMGSDA